MNADLHARLRALPAPLRQQVDVVCDRFETAWQTADAASDRPRIEDYLGSGAAAAAPALVQQLVLVDIEQRRRRGESPRPQDYQGCFPDLDPHWLLQALAPATDPTATAPVAPGPEKASLAPASAEGQRLRCPHCHNPILLQDDRPEEVLCTACGSSFQVRDARQTTTAAGMRPLGKFQLLERVGVGAFGAVWKARDTVLDRLVALKIPHAGLLVEPDELERFHREARAAAQLRHPGIVTVYEVQVLEGLPTIVADFIEGAPLKDLLQTRRLTFRQTATLLADVAEALDYAHEMGVIHRDLKPANIMLDYRQPLATSTGEPAAAGEEGACGVGKPLLMDFGLALRAEAEVTMTLEGQIIGTPAYMSPEQAAGKGHQVDRRSDVYSLGVILYEMLTGELPFRGSRAMLLVQVLREDPRPPRRSNDKIPRDLETICLKALAKEPSRRYATAQELADDLRHWLNGEPIQARPISAWEQTWRWCRRNPREASLVAAVLLLLTLVAVVGSVGYVQTALALRRAEAQEHEAQDQRLKAEQQQAEAERQRDLARAAEVKASRSLYVANMQLAEQIWESERGTAQAVRDVLAAHVPEKDEEDLRDFAWRYQWRLLHQPPHAITLKGHVSKVVQGAFCPDGQLLTLDTEQQLYRWDLASRRATSTRDLRGQQVALARDGQTVAVGMSDGTVQVLDAVTGRERHRIRAHTGWIWVMCFLSGNQTLLTRGHDGMAKVWDLRTGQEREPIQGETARLPGEVRLPDEVPVFQDERIANVALSPDGSTAAVRTGPNVSWVEVVDWRKGRAGSLGTFRGHRYTVRAIACSPDGQTVASGADNGQVILWDSATQKQHGKQLDLHARPVTKLAFSPDGSRLATGGWDGLVTVCDVATRQRQLRLKGHTRPITFLAFAVDGKTLASGSVDGIVKVWDLTAATEERTLHNPDTVGISVAYSPDGTRLAAASRDGVARLWDVRTGDLVATLRGPSGVQVGRLAFAPDGKMLATGGTDSQVRLWDVATRQELRMLSGRPSTPPDQSVGSLAFSPDGTLLAVGFGWPGLTRYFDYDQIVKVWDLGRGDGTAREIGTLPAHRNTIPSLAFSRDGKLLATASHDRTVKLWQVGTWQAVRTLTGPNGFTAVAFSPDGRMLAAGSFDGTIRFWEVASGRAGQTLTGHADWVWELAFSPDGRTLASGSLDKTVRLWDVLSGRQTRTLQGHTDALTGLAFSPDGNTLATGSMDNTMRLWEAGSPQAIAAVLAEDQALEARRKVRADALRIDETKFILDWLVLGPIFLKENQTGAEAVDQQQIPEEARLQPRAEDTITLGGKELVWKEWKEHRPGQYFITLGNAVGGKAEHAVAYAVCYLISPTERKDLRLKIGSDDQAKVYLNGKRVYTYHGMRGVWGDGDPEEDTVENITLRQGRNVLVCKVVNEVDFWRLSLRVVDAEGKPVPDTQVRLTP